MKTRILVLLAFAFFLMTISRCKQLYNPPALEANLGYLVVDGAIIAGDSTIINLSRTQNLTDSTYINNPETGAQVSIIGQNAESYNLIEENRGKYVVANIGLNFGELYRLKIITNNGKQYLSDPVPLKQTPAIDSITWDTANNLFVQVNLNTHDPQNNTRYYRWQYSETWQFNSQIDSHLINDNGVLRMRTPFEDVHTCWNSANSTNIIIGTSAKLAQDVIYQQQIVNDSIYISLYPVKHQLVNPFVSQKFSIEYSVLIKQYAMGENEYNFWQNLKQNTEQLGTIFAPQPGQVTGNVHCQNNPNEPVLGYVGACSIQEKRIFIKSSDLFPGTVGNPDIGCSKILITPAQINQYLGYPTLYTPVDSVFAPGTSVFLGVDFSYSFCADCTQSDGLTNKPAFWPN